MPWWPQRQGHFFSDTEQSTGNVIQAGAIDLTVSNHAWYNGIECAWDDGDDRYEWTSEVTQTDSYLASLIGEPCESTWEASDLDGHVFFNLLDLKPGDWEEDTIDLTVDNNDAYACMEIDVTATPENGQTEPEADVDATAGDQEGELQDEINFVWWVDDGDNVLEEDEQNIFGNTTLADLDGAVVALSDTSQDSIWDGPLVGETTYYIGKAFCHGDMTLAPVTPGDNSPADNPGFTCDGASVTNASQTDGVEVSLAFTAIQSRNNGSFTCVDERIPDPEVTETDGWSIVDTGDGKDWFAKAKVQEPNPASDFEVQVGINDGSLFDQGDTEYSDNVPAAFTLVYDGSGTATFTANGVATSYAVGTTAISNIGITIKAPSDATTTVDSLSLSTGSLSDTDVTVTDGTRNLTITGASLDSGFTLTGNVTFDWDTLTSNGEDQKMQISIN